MDKNKFFFYKNNLFIIKYIIFAITNFFTEIKINKNLKFIIMKKTGLFLKSLIILFAIIFSFNVIGQNIVITEIMYNPPEGGTDSLEFIELYNNSASVVDLQGFVLCYSTTTDTFAAGVSINPYNYLVVSIDSVAFKNFYGFSALQGPTLGISNTSTSVWLKNTIGTTIDSLEYDDSSPWPTEPDGNGPSLVLCDYNSDNSDGANWTYSTVYVDTIANGDTIWASPGLTDSTCIIDVAIFEWIAPNSGCGLTSTESVSVRVTNIGTQILNNIPIGYIFNGTLIGPEQIPVLNVGDTIIYTFSGTFDFSTPDLYKGGAATVLSGDENTSNDTIYTEIYSYGDISGFPFTEDFETGSTVYFRLQNNNESDIEVIPNMGYQNFWKLSLNGSVSGSGWTGGPTDTDSTNAWVDDTLHHASAITCNVDALALSNLTLNFDLKQYYSFGDKYNWFRVLINDTVQVSDINGITDFNPLTKNSDTYVKRIFDLSSYAGTNFKLTLQSSCRYEDDQVFVDNINLFEPTNNDVGITSVLNPKNALCGASDDSVIVVITNFGTVNQDTVPVTVVVTTPSGDSIVSDTLFTDLSMNEFDTLFVGNVNTMATGYYQTKAYTSLSTDIVYNDNDTLVNQFMVTFPNALPYFEDFESSLLVPDDWNTDMHVDSILNHGNISNVLCNVLDSLEQSAYAITPKIGPITANSKLIFYYRIVEAFAPYDTMFISSTDSIHVMITNNCGTTYNNLYTIDSLNHIPNTEMASIEIPLDSYTVDTVFIKFLSSTETNDTNGFYVDLDNVAIAYPPVIDLGPDTSICSGDSITFDAGTGIYTYVWRYLPSTDTISVSQTITVDSSGTYAVTVENQFGLSNSDTVVLTVNPTPTADAGPNKNLGCGESVMIGGTSTPGCLYDWAPTDGLDDPNIANPTVSPSISATYRLTVTDTNFPTNCFDIDSVDVTVADPPIASITPLDTSICEGDSVTLSVGTIEPGVTYIWNPASDSIVATSIKVFPTDTVTDTLIAISFNLLCIDTAVTDVNIIPFPVVDLGLDRDLCFNDSTILDATGPGYTYLWSNDSTYPTLTIVGSDAGLGSVDYSVTVTNFICQDIDTVNITVISSPTVTISPSDTTICEGECVNLTAGVSGGSSPYIYEWDTAGIITQSVMVCPIVTTTYILTVTESGGGCSDIDSAVVTVNPSPFVDLGPDSINLCLYDSVTLNAADSGCTYLWSDFTIDSTLTVLGSVIGVGSADISVTVTNSYVCNAIDTVTITVHPLPVAYVGADTFTCDNECIELIATGAGPGGSYLWSTSEITDSVTVCPTVTTTYTVTATDEYGCSDADDVIVTVNPSPIIDLGPDTINLCLYDSITLDATCSGCTYLWSGGTTDSVLTVLGSDIGVGSEDIFVTATNSYGCHTVDSVTVVVNPLPVAYAGVDTSVCYGNCVGLVASGGETYSWSTGEDNVSVTVCPLSDSTYTVTATDEYGCTDADDIIVTVYSLPVVDLGPDTSICFVADIYHTDSIILDATCSGCSYLWMDGLTDSVYTVIGSSVGLGLRNYSVIVTDVKGCQNTDSVTVTVEDCSGIEDMVNNNNIDINVFPNPNNGTFHVSINGLTNNTFDLVIFSIKKQVVFKKKLKNISGKYNKQINISDFSKGIYYLKLVDGDNIRIEKIIVQ